MVLDKLSDRDNFNKIRYFCCCGYGVYGIFYCCLG